MDEPSDAVLAEVRRLLETAGVTQYRLQTEAGLGAQTARKLLGKEPGATTVDAINRALALLKPPREVWHRPRR